MSSESKNTIVLDKESLIDILGIEKCRKLFPDDFKQEKMHSIESFEIGDDILDDMITIGTDYAFNAKYTGKCLVLNDKYVWRIMKRYDLDGVYRTYLVPILRSEYKQRRRRKTVKE